MTDMLYTAKNIGPVTIPNRTVFLAHETGFAENGLPTERDAAYYQARARGGVGLIIGPSSMLVHPSASNPMYASGYDPKVVPRLEMIADACHEYGTKVFAQLQHTGGEDSGEFAMHETWAPSAVPTEYGYEMPKRMEIEDIEEIKLGFAKTAQHVKQGSLDGIELKAGHDGILRQFLSPKYNKRDDKYGGSIDARVRLINEVIEAIRNRVGESFPVGIRLTLDEMEAEGYDYDYAVEIIQRLHPSLDFIDSDIATISKLYITDAPMHAPLGYTQEYYGGASELVDIPVIASGRINDLTKGNEILEEGRAEFVGMCRQLICDADTVRKARAGEDDEVVHCIACNQNCLGGIHTKGHVGCIQTPRSGRETEIPHIENTEPSSTGKDVLVIGGGPAGLSFAVTAADLGHRVTIRERELELGGQSNIATQVDSRKEFGDAVRNLLNQLDNRDVTVETETEVTPDDLGNESWDEVVVATGADERPPPLEGEDVHRSWDVLDGEDVGKSVLVLDNNKHAAGVGLAEQLATEGHDVTLATTSYHPGDRLEGTNVPPFLESLYEHDVEMLKHTTAIGWDDHTAQLMNVYSEAIEERTADSLVVAERRESRNGLADAVGSAIDDPDSVHRIGDCVAPRLIDAAIYDGELLARELA
jgi:2,4-dienoyl-CoA reductase-like NADH-dependent reductase (Old Yellow Enzyme family)/thioredoxin reductase